MQALSEIEGPSGHSQEMRLKAFRTLLKTGVLRRADDGQYALSSDARYGFENRLRA